MHDFMLYCIRKLSEQSFEDPANEREINTIKVKFEGLKIDLLVLKRKKGENIINFRN